VVRARARNVAAVLAGLVAALSLVAPPAEAAAAPSVSLLAAPPVVTFGQGMTLSGRITPWHVGETVQIVGRAGTVLATATTATEGKYSTQYVPTANVWVHAEYNGASSATIKLRVRPLLTVRLTEVHVFGTGIVHGKLRPLVPGGKVDITLLNGSRRVLQRTVALQDGRSYSTEVPIGEPGTYRVRASFSDPDHAPVTVLSSPVAAGAQELHVGSRGLAVRALEERLVELHYHLGDAKDGTYDGRTADAVMAFRKVQGLDRVDTVDSSVWRALADPRMPRPRFSKPTFHIEVNQTLQVLFVVNDGEVTDILQVSTGKPSTPTHDGHFHVWLREPGYNDKLMYYSSFFDDGRAIHGYSDVPPYAASHGCVRIPIWAAVWMYGLDPIGTSVIVYH
jgi:hypothetical protein